MEVQFKLKQISKNVLRFDVVPQSGMTKKELAASGMPGFGSMELVVPTEEELKNFETGQKYTITLDDPDEEVEIAEPKPAE